ncbi:MAG: hypothetical protein KGQ54_06010 [Verrucomicrobia bacterium]|nr:hypothetical protein [Verrucomicrobiota bacterium]
MSIGLESIFSNNFYNPVFMQKDSTRQALKKVSMVAGAVLLASALAPCVLASAPLLAKITIMKSAGALGCFLFARFIPKGKDHPDILFKRLNEEALNAFQNLAAFQQFYEQRVIQGEILPSTFLNPENLSWFERIEPIYQDYAAGKREIEEDQRTSLTIKSIRIQQAHLFYDQKLKKGARQ